MRAGKVLGTLLLAAATGRGARAQRVETTTPVAPSTPERVVSMGQPPRWMPYVSGFGALGGGDPRAGALAGVYHPIGSPVLGLLGVGVEAYAVAGGGDAPAGARLLEVARALNLGAGVDWDARAGNAVFVLSWNTALRRGGILGRGTTLRVDWLPPRRRSLLVGLNVPLFQPWAGRTRPLHTGVDLPPAPRGEPPGDATPTALPPAADSAMAAVREAARLLWLYTNFFTERDESGLEASRRLFDSTARAVRDSLAARTPLYPHGRSYAEAERVYRAQLARAFGAAAGDSVRGEALAARARAALLDEVILPYDALFGRVKNHQRDIGPLTARAVDRFDRWLRDSSGVDPGRRAAALAVERRLLDAVTDVHRLLVRQWDDSRRLWLPLQLALEPEDYDEQAEVDALIARAVGRPFTDRNELTYVRSFELPYEFGRSILAARDYHVLWIHDFAGRRPSGAVDAIGYREVADAYFPALARAVARYDSTGRLTEYHVFLDQNFYEPRDGRLWMTILEDPLGAAIDLPPGNGEMAAHLRERQRELRAAVAASKRLQADAAREGGEGWLRDVVKVHVDITQPSDFTFRSHRILPPLPFVPDNVMRDHRKLAFYDVTEAAPYAGAMILGGVGIGEHYASPTWDDRGMVARGPATLEARAALRRLLRLNGFAERDVPARLRETPAPANGAAAPPSDSGYVARVLQVHNEPGFGGAKYSSVARAMLYSLAPRGSVIVVPDGLWLSSEWAGMLAGAALRGCRVYAIAPALANAPSPGTQLSRAYDVVTRLLAIHDVFGAQLAAAGGDLRVGIYNPTEDVNDVAKQAREVRAGLDRAPWLRELLPFDSTVIAVLDTAPAVLAAAGYEPFSLARDEAKRLPQLHQKTQLVAEPRALAALARRPEWREALARGLAAMARRTTRFADPRGVDSARSARLGAGLRLLEGFEGSRTPEERRRASFYFTLGTQNQDPRGMMLDGEASFVVSGTMAAIGLVDFWFLMARSTWVTRREEIDSLLPPYDKFHRRMARFIRYVL